MPPPRPTVRTLAADLGVSPMTVSLALRNHTRVSLATRERVQQWAAKVGYRPDPSVTKLMHHLRARKANRLQASICGLMDSWPEALSQRHRYTERVLQGLRARAGELGYAFECLTLDEASKSKRIEKILLSRGIEGLVLLPRVRPTDMSDWLDWGRFSVLSVTSSILAPGFHTVVPHHFDNTLLACQTLVEQGRKSIGLVISRAWDTRVRHRWAGAILWQNTFGGTAPIPPFLGESTDLEGDIAALTDWIKRHSPEVIVTDEVSVPTLQRVLRSFPSKARPAVVRLSRDGSHPEGGIDQRSEEIGRTALELLAGMIVHGDRGIPVAPHMTSVSGVWKEGVRGKSASPTVPKM